MSQRWNWRSQKDEPGIEAFAGGFTKKWKWNGGDQSLERAWRVRDLAKFSQRIQVIVTQESEVPAPLHRKMALLGDNTHIFPKGGRRDFECFHHKERITLKGDRCSTRFENYTLLKHMVLNDM